MENIGTHEQQEIKRKRGRPKGTGKPLKEPEERDPTKPPSYYGKYKYQYKYEINRRAEDPEYKRKKQDKVNQINKSRYATDEAFRNRIIEQSRERRKKVAEVYKAFLESQKNT